MEIIDKQQYCISGPNGHSNGFDPSSSTSSKNFRKYIMKSMILEIQKSNKSQTFK